MTCPDLCTAAKCAELENRINQLELCLKNISVELILTGSQLGISLAVCGGHDTSSVTFPFEEFLKKEDLSIDVGLSLIGNNLTSSVQIIDISDSATVELPTHKSNLAINGSLVDKSLNLTISDGSSFDTAEIQLPFLQKEDLSIDVGLSLVGNNLTSSVQIIDISDSATVELTTHESNLAINGSCENGGINLTVSDGLSVGSAWIDLCLDDFMDCNDIINKLNDLDLTFKNIDNNININLKSLFDDLNLDFSKDITNIETKITTEIESLKNSFNFESEFTDIETKITTEIESLKNSFDFESEFTDIETKITTEIESLKNSFDFESEFTDIETKIIAEINALNIECPEIDLTAILEKLEEIYDELVKELDGSIEGLFECKENENKILTPSNSQITYAGKGFSGIQSMLTQISTNLYPIFEQTCNDSGNEVVAIVSSDKVINNTPRKQLILHFVTLDNYPKRSQRSSYRPIQIPEPLDEFDWNTHFKDLRWHQGLCYSELYFKDYKTPVSGYFENKDKANEYFNSVVTLTTLEETNRLYHERTHHAKLIPVRETRPYRAFIVEIDEFGQPICKTKYVPVI